MPGDKKKKALETLARRISGGGLFYPAAGDALDAYGELASLLSAGRPLGKTALLHAFPELPLAVDMETVCRDAVFPLPCTPSMLFASILAPLRASPGFWKNADEGVRTGAAPSSHVLFWMNFLARAEPPGVSFTVPGAYAIREAITGSTFASLSPLELMVGAMYASMRSGVGASKNLSVLRSEMADGGDETHWRELARWHSSGRRFPAPFDVNAFFAVVGGNARGREAFPFMSAKDTEELAFAVPRPGFLFGRDDSGVPLCVPMAKFARRFAGGRGAEKPSAWVVADNGKEKRFVASPSSLPEEAAWKLFALPEVWEAWSEDERNNRESMLARIALERGFVRTSSGVFSSDARFFLPAPSDYAPSPKDAEFFASQMFFPLPYGSSCEWTKNEAATEGFFRGVFGLRTVGNPTALSFAAFVAGLATRGAELGSRGSAPPLTKVMKPSVAADMMASLLSMLVVAKSRDGIVLFDAPDERYSAEETARRCAFLCSASFEHARRLAAFAREDGSFAWFASEHADGSRSRELRGLDGVFENAVYSNRDESPFGGEPSL